MTYQIGPYTILDETPNRRWQAPTWRLWRARDTTPGADLFLATLQPWWDVARFRALIAACERLHRNAALVWMPRWHDWGEEDGHFYIAVERPEGLPIDAWVDAPDGPPPMSPDDASDLIAQVCHAYDWANHTPDADALFAAWTDHPACEEGRVVACPGSTARLVGFGWPTLHVDVSAPTFSPHPEQLICTSYEELLGLHCTRTRRRLFALGNALYKLTTGHMRVTRRHQESIFHTYRALVQRERVTRPPARFVPDIDPTLSRAILRTLAPQDAHTWACEAALMVALLDWSPPPTVALADLSLNALLSRARHHAHADDPLRVAQLLHARPLHDDLLTRYVWDLLGARTLDALTTLRAPTRAAWQLLTRLPEAVLPLDALAQNPRAPLESRALALQLLLHSHHVAPHRVTDAMGDLDHPWLRAIAARGRVDLDATPPPPPPGDLGLPPMPPPAHHEHPRPTLWSRLRAWFRRV